MWWSHLYLSITHIKVSFNYEVALFSFYPATTTKIPSYHPWKVYFASYINQQAHLGCSNWLAATIDLPRYLAGSIYNVKMFGGKELRKKLSKKLKLRERKKQYKWSHLEAFK